MAKIRHVALTINDPEKSADFYKITFGMKEVHRGEVKDGLQAIYLSDGYINLALLPARGRPEGVEHFGFQVDSIEETGRISLKEGAKQGATPRPNDGRFAEFRIHDCVGSPVDLSEQGWKV